MLLWRISRHRDLSGAGGLRAPGRWHERGSRVVYLADTPAGALLEACVHTSAGDVPPNYTLLAVFVAEDVSTETVDTNTLPSDWADGLEGTREIGSAWLRSQRSALLRVPSALVPATFNYLLNPLHSDAARLRIESVYEYPFDPRIKK
ncbi:MAG TPA: RES family NAD+ phosphorylase [Terriglobales bacterium]|nr:RES family NAD+ phosphorylase [Terriglobales bacterium]